MSEKKASLIRKYELLSLFGSSQLLVSLFLLYLITKHVSGVGVTVPTNVTILAVPILWLIPFFLTLGVGVCCTGTAFMLINSSYISSQKELSGENLFSLGKHLLEARLLALWSVNFFGPFIYVVLSILDQTPASPYNSFDWSIVWFVGFAFSLAFIPAISLAHATLLRRYLKMADKARVGRGLIVLSTLLVSISLLGIPTAILVGIYG